MAVTRILIAEDNDLVALTLEEQLKGLGYDVIGIARTGAEAIDLAARHVTMPLLPRSSPQRSTAYRRGTPCPVL